MATISGHKIRQAIERVGLRRKTTTTQFEKSIFAFAGEDANPPELATQVERAEILLARLQDLQEQFNQQTNVTASGDEITLAMAIKLVGGYNRLARSWKEAAEKDHGADDYFGRRRGGGQLSRDKEKDYAARQISVNECITAADAASGKTAALRAAIAEANSGTIEVPGDMLTLFEEFLPGLL